METTFEKLSKNKYSYKAYKLPIDAQIVGEELEKVESFFGAITPENVVDYATDDSTPIHELFEWNDAKAAHAYRKQQARAVINSVHVVIEKENAEPVITRAFFNVVEDGKGSTYMPAEIALKNTSSREYIINDVKKDLLIIKEKLENIEEASELINVIHKFISLVS